MIITIIIYVHKAISTYCSTIFVIFNPVELLLIELYHLQTVYFVHTTYIKVIYKLYSHMYIFKLYTVLLCRSLYTVQPIVGHLGNLVSCRLQLAMRGQPTRCFVFKFARSNDFFSLQFFSSPWFICILGIPTFENYLFTCWASV